MCKAHWMSPHLVKFRHARAADVAAYQEALDRHVVGQPLGQVKVLTPFLLRSYEPPLEVFHGQLVRGIRRIGKRLVFVFDHELFLVLHLMIAGRLRWRRPAQKLGMGPKIGNAYSNEILHAAQLSPLKQTKQLGDDEKQRLFRAVGLTLVSWRDILRSETGDGFPEEVTAFRKDFAVHGRFGRPAPPASRRCSGLSTQRTRPTIARGARPGGGSLRTAPCHGS